MPIFARFCDLGAFAQNERTRLLWFCEILESRFLFVFTLFTRESLAVHAVPLYEEIADFPLKRKRHNFVFQTA